MTIEARLRPRKQPRQHRAWETRGRILVAAARVFARYGYAAGTTNRIAEEARLSVGSLYQYFPNKDAILVELMNAHVEEGARLVTEAFADIPEDVSALPLPALVRPFVRAALRNHAGDPALHRVLFEEAPRPASFLERMRALEADLVTRVEGLLNRHPAVGVTDRHLAAWTAVATVESLTHRYVAAHPAVLDADGFEDELTRLVVAYLRAEA